MNNLEGRAVFFTHGMFQCRPQEQTPHATKSIYPNPDSHFLTIYAYKNTRSAFYYVRGLSVILVVAYYIFMSKFYGQPMCRPCLISGIPLETGLFYGIITFTYRQQST